MIEYEFKKLDDFDSALSELYRIITVLRSPEGCPWDIKQTNRTVIQSLMGEIYEYLDALDSGDKMEAAEEIGDVLMNTLMLLEIHEQNQDFKPLDSINSICEKLYRRHPHVFTSGNPEIKDADQVISLWDNIKRNVEGRKDHDDDDFFSKIPRSKPQLEQAYETQKKVEKLGFDWKTADGVYDKVLEELEEVRRAETQDEREMELGDLLFTVINLARFHRIHPETALHRSLTKFQRRFNLLMDECKHQNIELAMDNFEQMNRIWEQIKLSEKK